VITFDQVIPPLSVNLPDAVKMRIVLVIYLTNETATGLRFVGHDFRRAV